MRKETEVVKVEKDCPIDLLPNAFMLMGDTMYFNTPKYGRKYREDTSTVKKSAYKGDKR